MFGHVLHLDLLVVAGLEQGKRRIDDALPALLLPGRDRTRERLDHRGPVY